MIPGIYHQDVSLVTVESLRHRKKHQALQRAAHAYQTKRVARGTHHPEKESNRPSLGRFVMEWPEWTAQQFHHVTDIESLDVNPFPTSTTTSRIRGFTGS